MKRSDAAQILGLSGEVTPEEVEQAYRQAALKFHRDRNPAGAAMMKIINAADDVLNADSTSLRPGGIISINFSYRFLCHCQNNY